MPGAGTGLVAAAALAPFAWVGLYPGKVTPKVNSKRAAHTMGSSGENFIIADEAVKAGAKAQEEEQMYQAMVQETHDDKRRGAARAEKDGVASSLDSDLASLAAAERRWEEAGTKARQQYKTDSEESLKRAAAARAKDRIG